MEQEVYTYLGIIELDKIKESEMKERHIKEYKRRLSLILRSKLNGRNKFTAMNTWEVAIFRHGAGILSRRVHELNSLDRKTNTIMTMYGAFHPKKDVDRLYLTRRDGGRGLISLGLYVKNSAEKLIERVLMARTIETEGTISKSDFKPQKLNESKQK